MNAEEFLNRYDLEKDGGIIEITFEGLVAHLEQYHYEKSQESQPVRLSDEEIDGIVLKYCKKGGYHYVLLNKVANDVRDRTGRGVDLEKELNDYAQHVLNQPTIGHTENALGSKGIKDYLTQRNQQEKG